MLAEVRIRDLVLLERVDVVFSPGLNVLSGETGEGKSLLMLAISLLLGTRSRKGLVRSGCAEAVVEGRFLLKPGQLASVTDLLPATAEEVCLRRTIGTDGQSRAYLDGSFCSLHQLAALARALVDVHGQHQSLADARAQQQTMDRFGGTEGLAACYAAAFESWVDLERQAREHEESRGQMEERAEFLRFQIRELRKAAPREDEERELMAGLKLASGARELMAALDEVSSRLAERDDAIASWCARLCRILEREGGGHGALDLLRERIAAFGEEAGDIARDAADLLGGLDLDPSRLPALEARMAELDALSRRHRVPIDRLPSRLSELESQLAAVEGRDDHRANLEQEILAAGRALQALGGDLASKRIRAARALEAEVVAGLRELRMPHATFSIRVQAPPEDAPFDPKEFGREGPGRCAFFVAANPGEPGRPLKEVASGGEMARVLLAIKGALAGAHDIPLLIFDEIDSGVGGRVGLPFGRRIAAIARFHQVLVVTHLAQVAAFASHHLRVRKELVDGRTRTRVDALSPSEREVELAEMLGGDASDPARAQARALLAECAP